MKTPDEIKKGLECCSMYPDRVECMRSCPYESEGLHCIPMLAADAHAYIRELEEELATTKDRESGLSIMLTSAQSAAETWERKYKEALSKLETTTWERDALKEDILRAQDKANDMQIELLDGEVHPTCDYSLYSALCDALSDVVAWENKELLEATTDDQ